ncbi:MAG: protein adenylyltransferase SelO family protein, partial [Planctomycetota bacterium]|nr:protein adenylyltransferase SelO family protein [Planctomycetota bacterium]
PELGAPPAPEPVPQAVYVAWLEELRDRTARMIAHWSRVGFVHGVMNTDNMSILGETIDYGPYGWLEDYDPDWTPNTTDAQGKRYRFGHQAAIGHWNLTRLASAVVPLLGETEPLQALVDGYPEVYAAEWGAMLAAKRGFESFEEDLDAPLAAELFRVLGSAETDMTIFFRRLADVTADTEDPFLALQDAYYAPDGVNAEVRGALASWTASYLARAEQRGVSDDARRERMNRTNPRYVLRNYLAQLAIDRAEKGDDGGVSELLEVLRRPYEDQAGKDAFAEKRPEWARHRPGCSMLSCSS